MKLIFISVLSLILISCNKPDSNPELKDPIYLDLVSSVSAVTAQLENEIKTLEDHKKNLKEVALQTGQNKYAEKRVRESIERINKLKQKKQYLELKVEAQKKESKRAYLEAFKKGDPWPDQNKFKFYQIEKKFHSASRAWSAKTRIEEFKGKSNKNGPVEPPPSH